MYEVKFTWDPGKAARNQRVHGVAFEDAQTVFYDEMAIIIDDPDHSQDEERFLIIGIALSLRVLIVSHCYREKDEVIRIISARRATKKETKGYERGLL